MILDEIGGLLESAKVIGGTTGWPWFQGYSPAEPDQCVVISESGGEGRPVATDLLDLELPRFQIKVRGARATDDPASYGAARTELEAIVAALHGLTAQTLGSAGYPYIFAEGNAVPLGLDANNRPEIVHNFRCAREG